MNKITGMMFVMLMAGLPSAAFAETSYPKYYGFGDAGMAEAFAEVEKADFSITCNHGDKLDIGAGESGPRSRHPITFSFDELRSFWKQQRHKDFIVVTLAKSTLTDEQNEALVRRLNEYFLEAGFRRVRIHQGLGGGVGVLSDVTQPQQPPKKKQEAP